MALQTSSIQLPKDVVVEMIEKAQLTSTIAALSPSTPQLFRDKTHLIFNPASEAEVVDEGAQKTSYEQQFTPIEGRRVKLVTTTRVSNELQWADEDNQLEIISAITRDQTEALARAIDYVVYYNVSPKGGNALSSGSALVDTAQQINSVDGGTKDLDALADALIDYNINGIALSRKFASNLRKIRVENTGLRLYPEIPLNLKAGVLDGINAVTSNTVDASGLRDTMAGSMITNKAAAIMGDFSLIKWGMVRDITSEIIEYGDPDGGGDLKAYNQVAYRTESMLAFAILDTKGFATLTNLVASV